MRYTQVVFELKPLLPAREVLVAELADIGFDSFEETESGLKAYIPSDEFKDEMLSELMTSAMPYQHIEWKTEEMPDQNWNAEWEKNFEPIVVDDKCLIRAPFHTGLPTYLLEIIIEPKMSFGTGHHATTHLMIAEMMKMEWKEKRVLDMGSGTGVLAIAAEKLGATQCDAIDIDEWAYENAIENLQRNACSVIHCIKGGAEAIPTNISYDVVLANINRNILTRDMHLYNDALASGGEILFSGFYIHDKKDIDAVAATFDWVLEDQQSRGEWCMLCYKKP